MLCVIELTRFNGTKFYLNADLIEYIEATPDTVVTLSSGNRHLVKEDVLTVVERIIAYNRRIHYIPVSEIGAARPDRPAEGRTGEEVETSDEKTESLPD
jgi:flagellar protein FlbD